MTITINGTTGISGVDGSSGTPAYQGNDANTGISFGTDIVTINTGGTARVTTDASGNVGIGTTSISYSTAGRGNITLGGSASGIFGFQIGGVAKGYIGHFGSSMDVFNDANSPLTFGTNSTERMRIDSSGNLGLGVTPSAWSGVSNVFQIKGNAYVASTTHVLNHTANAFFNGTNWIYTSTNFASQTEQVSGQHRWYIAPSGTAGNAISFTQAMTLDSSGNLGIGTAPSGYKLDLKADLVNATGNATALRLRQDGDGGIAINMANGVSSLVELSATVSSSGAGTDDSNFVVKTALNGTLSERMRLDSSGNLLVGTASVSSTQINGVNSGGFAVQGAQQSGGGGVLGIYNSASSSADDSPPLVISKAMTTTSSSARFVQFYAGGLSTTAMGGIVGNGASNVQFASLSDVREKTNITPISGSLDKVLALNPVEFDWLLNGEHCPAGFVAQDVEQVFPEFVVENIANDEDDPRKGLTGGMTGGIIAHLVKAIQELTARLEALENK